MTCPPCDDSSPHVLGPARLRHSGVGTPQLHQHALSRAETGWDEVESDRL